MLTAAMYGVVMVAGISVERYGVAICLVTKIATGFIFYPLVAWILHMKAFNEAVELAKLYAGSEDASFLNGVLGGIAKGMEADA